MALVDSKGTTLECLREFSVNNGFKHVSKKDAPRRKNLCTILGINPQKTGREWFDKFTLPTGINLIKLQILLESMGYTVTERMNLSTLAHRVGDHMIFCDVLPKDLATRVGVQDNAIMNWATGQVPTDEKMVRIEEILQEGEPQVNAGKQAWRDALASLNLIPAPALKVEQAVRKTGAKNHSDFVIRMLKGMECIVTDIRKLSTDEFTVEDRELFFTSGVTAQLTQAVDNVNLMYLMKDLRAGPVGR